MNAYKETKKLEVFAEEITITAFPVKTWEVILAEVATGSPLQLGFTDRAYASHSP